MLSTQAKLRGAPSHSPFTPRRPALSAHARVTPRHAALAALPPSADSVPPPCLLRSLALSACTLRLALLLALPADARLEGVNNPQLLPPGPPVPVLDVAGFLSPGQVARLTREVVALERDTGIRLRVLAQAYPNTPGLAVKDYWKVDDSTVVFVADPNTGNIRACRPPASLVLLSASSCVVPPCSLSLQ